MMQALQYLNQKNCKWTALYESRNEDVEDVKHDLKSIISDMCAGVQLNEGVDMIDEFGEHFYACYQTSMNKWFNRNIIWDPEKEDFSPDCVWIHLLIFCESLGLCHTA